MSMTDFLLCTTGFLAGFSLVTEREAAAGAVVPVDGKQLGTVYNACMSTNFTVSSGPQITVKEYRDIVGWIVTAQPGVLAQNVGLPDPVSYRSEVATSYDKYVGGHIAEAVGALRKAGTDQLALSIEVCREQGVLIVASYRMNSEDYGKRQLDLSDFGRAHKDWAIAGRNCLDPAVPEVYGHRTAIFREVAENYDIDGIEFDFKRSHHMISDPLKNHTILTQMVRDTRKMLDEVARRKGRKKLILGVRVEPILAGELDHEEFPGVRSGAPGNRSCRNSGLDVETWIKEGLVDYVCPTFFWPKWPGLPRTAEFADLTRGTNVGVYPTIWPLPAWLPHHAEQGPARPIGADDRERRLRYRRELGELALQCFADGADGISAYNWVQHHQASMVKNPKRLEWGDGLKQEQMDIFPKFRSEQSLREYLAGQEP